MLYIQVGYRYIPDQRQQQRQQCFLYEAALPPYCQALKWPEVSHEPIHKRLDGLLDYRVLSPYSKRVLEIEKKEMHILIKPAIEYEITHNQLNGMHFISECLKIDIAYFSEKYSDTYLAVSAHTISELRPAPYHN